MFLTKYNWFITFCSMFMQRPSNRPHWAQYPIKDDVDDALKPVTQLCLKALKFFSQLLVIVFVAMFMVSLYRMYAVSGGEWVDHFGPLTLTDWLAAKLWVLISRFLYPFGRPRVFTLAAFPIYIFCLLCLVRVMC